MEHITKVRRRFRWKEKQKACLDCITHKLHLLLSHVQTRDHVSCTYVHVSPTHHAIGVNHLSPHSNLHVFRWVGLQYQHCMASWKNQCYFMWIRMLKKICHMSGISVENYSDYTNRSKKLTLIKSFVSVIVIVKLMTSASMIQKKARKRSQDINM